MVNIVSKLQNCYKPTCISGVVGLPYRNAPVFS